VTGSVTERKEDKEREGDKEGGRERKRQKERSRERKKIPCTHTHVFVPKIWARLVTDMDESWHSYE